MEKRTFFDDFSVLINDTEVEGVFVYIDADIVWDHSNPPLRGVFNNYKVPYSDLPRGRGFKIQPIGSWGTDFSWSFKAQRHKVLDF